MDPTPDYRIDTKKKTEEKLEIRERKATTAVKRIEEYFEYVDSYYESKNTNKKNNS